MVESVVELFLFCHSYNCFLGTPKVSLYNVIMTCQPKTPGIHVEGRNKDHALICELKDAVWVSGLVVWWNSWERWHSEPGEYNLDAPNIFIVNICVHL